MLDLLIRNARLCDGTGAPSRIGDLGIRDGRLVTVGETPGTQEGATREIDATGLVAAPGFIDPHTHFDAQLTWDGQARPSLEHGVTTVIPGNCSLSLAPLREGDRAFLGAVFRQIEEMPKSAFDAGLTWRWERFGEYLDAIRGDLGINVAPLVGHSLLRLWVLGLESRERASTPAEIEAMCALLRESLDAGAIGLSTSFSDIDHEFRAVPCRLGTMDELRALCAVLGERGRVLQVLPEFWEADLLLTRIDQMAELSLAYGIPTTFSPLFESTTTPDLVGKVKERLELHAARGARVVAQMQTRPIDMTFDMTIPNAVFSAMPTWFGTLMQGEDAIRAAFADPTTRAALVEESKTDRRPIALDFQLGELRLSAARGAWKDHVGRTLADLGLELGLDPAEILMQISLDEDLRARFTGESLAHFDAPLIAGSIVHPQIIVGAGDGGAHVARFATYGDTGRLFSCFVRELGALTLEEAVKRLTADIADAWGIEGRGRLEPGAAADVVLFDPDTIARGPEELAFDLPGGGEDFRFVRRAVGVERVFVNGVEVYDAQSGYRDAQSGRIVDYRDVVGSAPSSEAPAPIRRAVHPEPGDDWADLAARHRPERPIDEAVTELQSWNLHLIQRPPTNPMTPLDLVFLEPPRPDA
jgi:N-acyl-D-aspartate/D-glutamate deacylase